jgi:catechol 2,3-dioxygenase-like lactoylglutathione lyase family enzyme
MIDHIAVQVADVEASLAFYLRVFAPIGMREAMRYPRGDSVVVGLCGPDGFPSFWLGRGTAAETRELHLAFRAPDRAAVDAVHEAAVEAGAEVLHAPREWPEYHP